MQLSKIFIATILMLFGQIGTFIQLQGSVKYGWYEKYFWFILLSSVPIQYLYIKAVNLYILGFGGEIWPSRLLGFATGIVVFTIMSSVLFKEHMTAKTIICLCLALTIVAVQIFWK